MKLRRANLQRYMLCCCMADIEVNGNKKPLKNGFVRIVLYSAGGVSPKCSNFNCNDEIRMRIFGQRFRAEYGLY